ncbi:phage Gp37/Gp68 family protein [Azotobacter vinelandii]
MSTIIVEVGETRIETPNAQLARQVLEHAAGISPSALVAGEFVIATTWAPPAIGENWPGQGGECWADEDIQGGSMTSNKTGIEWTDTTWNPIRGCSRASEGCRHCYAEQQAARIISMDRGRGIPEGQGSYDGLLARGGQWNGTVRLVPESLGLPLRWTKPRRIFVNSMSDLFHESVPFEFIASVFAVMGVTTRHTYQVLTKRPKRMLKFFQWLQDDDEYRVFSDYWPEHVPWVAQRHPHQGGYDNCGPAWPLENVWLGVTAENQAAADERIPLLLQVPAAVRWVSMEPLLGEVDLSRWLELGGLDTDLGLSNPGLDWVIVGGESGPNARPMHPAWARSLRDQCATAGAAAGVPFLFKQWGEWVPRSACYHTFEDGKSCSEHDPSSKRWPCIRLTEKGHDGRHLENTDQGCDAYMQRVGKKIAGRLLDGELHDAYPTREEAA